jgi:very-short-patch-repair endonuclease
MEIDLEKQKMDISLNKNKKCKDHKDELSLIEIKLKKFIDNGNKKFKNKFKYLKFIYKNNNTKGVILCPIHKEFEMAPYKHIQSKYGCWECAKIESSKTRTKTNDNYISDLKEKFNGQNIDYSKTDYKGKTKNVIIGCITHNCEIVINAGRLLNECEFACKECLSDNKENLKKPLLEKRLIDFIEKSNIKHNNKFKDAFINTIYKNNMTIIKFICPNNGHGEIEMTPNQHLASPTGCTKCSGKYVRSEEEFDTDLKSLHGKQIQRIDPYINQSTPMRIRCETHGEFPNKKTGNDLLNGHQGCPECQIIHSSESRSWKVDEWIKKSEEIYSEKKDDYTNITFSRDNDILRVHNILCNVHKTLYTQRASDHHRGHRCPKCKDDTLSETFKLPYKVLIQRCREEHKEENYDYDETEPNDYKNGYSKIPVICHKYQDKTEHGIWYPSAHNHINGSKCPSCINKTEQKMYTSLIQIYPILEKQYKVEWCKHISYLPFDFVLESLKIIIELDGPQHFIKVSNWKSPEETRRIDLYKMKCANDNGFSVIRILQEDVFYDKHDWLNELDLTIKKIEEEEKVQNVYLCKNNEYEHFLN